MNTHTVSRPQWKLVFDSFSRVYEGSSATLEVLDPELGAQMEVENQPFRGISYDKSGIELAFNTRDGRHLTHIIPHPTLVQIEEGDDGLVAALGIESDDDGPTIVRLHSPIPTRLLTQAKE
jgi:hypothetical protein